MDSEYLVNLPSFEEETLDITPSTSSGKRGRPCVSYGDSSESTKKWTALITEHGFEHICNASVQGLNAMREEIEVKLVEKLRLADSDTKSLYLNLIYLHCMPGFAVWK